MRLLPVLCRFHIQRLRKNQTGETVCKYCDNSIYCMHRLSNGIKDPNQDPVEEVMINEA